MSTKSEVQTSIVGFLKSFDPAEFDGADSGDRAEKLATGLTDHLEEQQMLNLTDAADVEESEVAGRESAE